ncbi:hypothetical protein AB6869_20175 [Rahnella rivi]|uniref:hypothetical protein n=1 Tax=Rahnella TaxID=34037 RepID=UPI001C25C82E|nr:hypothetical protein [Rahnella rivi]MBU9831833.1 hypothetical protein [Rahnella rivi]
MQPEQTGRSGDFQLFRIDNAGLGEPVATDNHLAVLYHPIRPQILPLLANVGNLSLAGAGNNGHASGTVSIPLNRPIHF